MHNTTSLKYISKSSEPLLDRIDLHIDVPAVEYEELSSRRVERNQTKCLSG
ncbi:hypothetical protein FBQ87_00110 [Sphingobacteriales bacterium CHB3]|nr:hypothetical protein [Sphingobacteriales bacterium CHB3]